MDVDSAAPSDFQSSVPSGLKRQMQSESPTPRPNHLKRVRIDSQSHRDINGLTSQPRVPTGPLCHHYALEYLKQATLYLKTAYTSLSSNSGKSRLTTLTPAQEYIRLHHLALAMLRMAAAQPEMTIREKAYVSLDFGRAALNVLRYEKRLACKSSQDSDSLGGASWTALLEEAAATVSKALLSVHKSTAHAALRRDLTVLQAAVTIVQGDERRAIKFIRKRREIQVDQTDHAYYYTLTLMLANIYINSDTPDVRAALGVLDELMVVANNRGDKELYQLGAVAQLRLIIASNLWSEVASAVETCSNAVGYVDPVNMPTPPSSRGNSSTSRGTSQSATPVPASLAADTVKPGEAEAIGKAEEAIVRRDHWTVTLKIHYLLLRAVWESREGATKRSKVLLDDLYKLVDSLEAEPRSTGTYEITLQPSSEATTRRKTLTVQLTPPNVLDTVVCLSTCISRRDTVGIAQTNRRLQFALRGLASFDHETGSVWDIPSHGYTDLAQINDMHRGLMLLRADLLLETATTLILRNSFDRVVEVTDDLIQHLRTHNLFESYGPRVSLLHAHLAHALGVTRRARQCYRACYSFTNAGSDLNVVARLGEMCLLVGTKGIKRSIEVETSMTALLEQCNGSSEAGIRIATWLLTAISADGLQQTKKCMARAIALANEAEHQSARGLLFAMSAALYAHTRPQQSTKMLESALTLAEQHGGRERPDGVGHAALGSWVARELGVLYHQADAPKDSIREMRKISEKHRARYLELQKLAPSIVSMKTDEVLEERTSKKDKVGQEQPGLAQ